MPATSRVASRFGMGIRILFALVAALVTVGAATGRSEAMQASDGETGAEIRIVHGIANAGPLDVYVDGSVALIGIVFAETSGDLLLASGEHEFAVVPSGASLDQAIAAGTIALQLDGRYFTTLLGTTDAASVGLFAIDDRALDTGAARFRIISGIPDAGETVPAFTGGDALSEPLQFGDATEYAAIEVGVYDLDLLDAVSGTPLLSLPQTAFNEGTATDVIVVGQVSEATLQALVIPTTVEVAQAAGLSAQVFAGTCAEPEDLIAEIGIVQVGQGAAVGASETPPVAQGFGLVAVSFSTLTESSHIIAVAEGNGASTDGVACGAIGGPLTDTGALVIALQTRELSEPGGVAVLAPALEDPQTTGISVFVTALE